MQGKKGEQHYLLDVGSSVNQTRHTFIHTLPLYRVIARCDVLLEAFIPEDTTFVYLLV